MSLRGVVVSFALLSAMLIALGSRASSKAIQPNRDETAMSMHAKGPFEVTLTPQDDKIDPTLGRMTIDKHFHGDLEATSKGQMLSASTATKGSAGYVAIEVVTGTLNGHAGTFTLQHVGTMNRGKPSLLITVVPDSGTGQLAGLSGTMSINIVDGKHSYDFDYLLPETR